MTAKGLEKSEHLHIKDIDAKIKDINKCEKILLETVKKIEEELVT